MKMRLLLSTLFFFVILCGSYGEESPAPDLLRVMTFNVRNSAADDGANHWKSRKELFKETVRKFDPDLLGLQEVLADQHDEIAAMLPDYTMVGVARDDGVRKGEWSAILYRTARFEHRRSGDFWLSESPGEPGKKAWDAACVRICTWSALKDRVTGKELLHANTHFDHQGRQAQINSSALILDQLSRLGGENAAVILTGDFNCTETDEAYHVLTRPSSSAGLRLIDSYRVVHPVQSPDEATFHGFKGKTTGSRIDWILHTGHFQPLSASIIRNTSERPASDHYPVTTVLKRAP